MKVTDILFETWQDEALDSFYVNVGLKIGPKTKIYRGEDPDEGGSGFATYGLGLYSTTNKSYAKQYGSVREVDRYDEIPQNPLRFKTVNDYQIWFQEAMKLDGYDKRSFNAAYPDMGKWITEKFDGVDGIQIGTGRDIMFVKYFA